ncbi:MAG: hypothetical protein AAGI34_06755 [Pseudomonadota bacterium]
MLLITVAVAPNLAPASLTATRFAFLSCMDNYSTPTFLTHTHNKTLPIKMLHYPEQQPDPSRAAISTGLIVLALPAPLLGAHTTRLTRMIA